ncbi:TauD/TfdA family dioxygenase [Actinomadura violacea]|uniref:TauD/TfdA family dioxygenase n=1 Tax=Actinomadura violacea TaxID=2819934 RepID=A0ABS3RXH6_9ACTN|nr:TauD/TfdA family dioxygenase [Actinomadura violacea]MBO2461467.1 TauD/TfdA family dioxygenase [Actinomadura violacea]
MTGESATQCSDDWRETLDRYGFVVLDDHSLAQVAPALGRPGTSALLTPHDRHRADPWSLSGVYGQDAFPWHTDGAVSARPPRWLVLRAVQINDAPPTELLDPAPALLAELRRTVLKVTDRRGRVRYLPAANHEPEPESGRGDGRWRLRWDPRTCVPRAGVTIDEVSARAPTGTVQWHEGRIAIVDNHRLMHRRPPVPRESERVLERTYFWDE